eukprot:Skav236744  [mRNA]  locus=scaffold2899:19273:22163:- [translate_table: standard]
MLRLLKPPEYYLEKYGTHFFGLNRMHLLMEKQRNRGQDGAGVANVKLDMAPGTKYIHCEKSIAADAWQLSFIPNTSELAFLGLAKQAQDHLDGQKADIFKALKANNGSPKLSDAQLQELLTAKVRTEKVVHKDAKIRTFIQEEGRGRKG